MHKSLIWKPFLSVSLAGLTLAMLSCSEDSEGPAGPQPACETTGIACNCEENWADEDDYFRFVSPAGGETYAVGETIPVRFCVRAQDEESDEQFTSTALVELRFEGSKDWHILNLTPETSSGHIRPFPIEEQLVVVTEGGETESIPMAGAVFHLRIRSYPEIGDYFRELEQPISIRP